MKLDQTRAQEAELPREISIVYSSSANGYEQNVQYARRLSGYSAIKTEVELPIAMSAEKAKAIAETALYTAIAGRVSVKFDTDLRYLELEAGDAVILRSPTRSQRVRITQKDDGAGLLKFQSVTDNRNAYQRSPKASGGVAPVVSMADIAGATSPPILDIKVYDLGRIEESDITPVGYASLRASGANFRGASLYIVQPSGGYRTPIVVNDLSKGGFTLNKLAAPGVLDSDGVDTVSRVTVQIGEGQTLKSIPRAQMLAGGGKALVGREVLQFQDATLVAEDTFELKNFLRGIRGTDAQVTKHDMFDDFLLLSTAIRIQLNATDIGQVRTMYAVGGGESIADSSMTQFKITDGGTLMSNPTAKLRVVAGGVTLVEGGKTDKRKPVFSGSGTPGDYASIYMKTSGAEAARVLVSAAGAFSYTPSVDLADDLYSAAYKIVRPSQAGPTTSAFSPAFAFEIAQAAGSVTYKYFRIFVTKNRGSPYTSIDLIRLYSKTDVNLPIPYGNYSSSGGLSGDYSNGPQFAFDSVGRAFNSTADSVTANAVWVAGWFAAPTEVSYMIFTWAPESSTPGNQPLDFRVEGSMDGVTYTTIKTVVGATSPPGGTHRVNF